MRSLVARRIESYCLKKSRVSSDVFPVLVSPRDDIPKNAAFFGFHPGVMGIKATAMKIILFKKGS